MQADRIVKEKLKFWAQRRGIKLIGSRSISSGNYQGEEIYTENLGDNLYQKILESTESEIRSGDGGELNGFPCKMQALHSSSLIAVNAFDYWRTVPNKEVLGKSLSIPSKNIKDIKFEQKFQILSSVPKHPNIDVVIFYEDDSVCAIECKFLEIFTSYKKKKEVDAKYFADSALWTGIPNLLKYAEQICSKNEMLNGAQLIKHTLGLLKNFKGNKKKFRLMYLWFDTIGESGYIHRKEIEEFSEYCKKDGIAFQNISWQELFINLLNNVNQPHILHSQYLCERYL